MKAFAAALVAVAVHCPIDFEYNDGPLGHPASGEKFADPLAKAGSVPPVLVLQIFSGKLRKVMPW
jgi:hypothetical protein